MMQNPSQLEEVIQNAAEAHEKYKKSTRLLRRKLIRKMIEGLEQRSDQMISAIVTEAKKPQNLAETELKRALFTLELAYEELSRWGGTLEPTDFSPFGLDYQLAGVEYVSIGVVLAITPFNFPLNLVMHKVAPALAVGAAVIVKPSPKAPLAALILKEIFDDAVRLVNVQANSEISFDLLKIVQCDPTLLSFALSDARIGVVSFTGSDRVGKLIQSQSLAKKVVLELGGNASVYIDQNADLDLAAQRCAYGAFAYSGQVCISVQNIWVHEHVKNQFKENLIKWAHKWGEGDSELIDEGALNRIVNWVDRAKAAGANVLCGASRVKNLGYLPTVLENVALDQPIVTEEAFGPIANLHVVQNPTDAINKINASKYGLQTGVFTDSIKTEQVMVKGLQSGAVLINEVPTYRFDALPYGGCKASGIGREGVRSAMLEYCDSKVVIKKRV